MQILLLYQISEAGDPYLASPIALRFDSGVTPTSTRDQLERMRETISRPEVVSLLINQKHLLENSRDAGGFGGDESFKFVEVRYVRFRISFLFRNSQDEEVEVDMESKLVKVF